MPASSSTRPGSPTRGYGLTALVDLGDWWEHSTGHPIPLGAILAHRERVDAAQAAEWVRASVRQAWAAPAASEPYVLEHAQEMEPDVVAQHIALYVNEFTENLGSAGYAAVRALLDRAAAGGARPGRTGRSLFALSRPLAASRR